MRHQRLHEIMIERRRIEVAGPSSVGMVTQDSYLEKVVGCLVDVYIS